MIGRLMLKKFLVWKVIIGGQTKLPLKLGL